MRRWFNINVGDSARAGLESVAGLAAVASGDGLLLDQRYSTGLGLLEDALGEEIIDG